jgi:hypothetical protein
LIRATRLTVVAASAALLIALAAPIAFSAVKKPTATVVFNPTVHVVGAHFKPKEKVVVTLVSVDTTWKKVAVAKKTGTFSVEFGAIGLNACNEYTLKVVGSLKSRASESHPVLPC